MKATGIVRRIDDLGRVVIPKEIRRTLRIRDGDPLEIFTEKDGEVIFKKYSPMGDLHELAGRVCEAVQKNLGFTRIITQRLNVPIVHSFQYEEFILHILSLWHGTNPICTIHLRNCHGSIRWSHRCISDTYVRCLTTCLIIISHLIGIERLCRTHYKSSLISFFEFLPRITHLPPI